MAFKIVWTDKAKSERKEIFTYWNWHNKSNEYSKSLNNLFKKHISFLASTPNIGNSTDCDGVKYLIVHTFFIFYRVDENEIVIMRIW